MKNALKMLFAAMLCTGLLCPACALASPDDAVLAYRDFETGEGFAGRILRRGVIGQGNTVPDRSARHSWSTRWTPGWK